MSATLDPFDRDDERIYVDENADGVSIERGLQRSLNRRKLSAAEVRTRDSMLAAWHRQMRAMP